jgi:pimeloyl-ACP methyl ester carboxylesterase
MDIKNQSELVENHGIITGQITNTANNATVYVSLHQRNGEFYDLVNRGVLLADNRFIFHVQPGSYFISAFADQNNDGEYQSGESAAYLGMENQVPEDITVHQRETATIDPLLITAPIPPPTGVEPRIALTKAAENIGRIVSLNEPMFAMDLAPTGMWRPLDYLSQYGGGLMLLQAYEAEKIPVLFVHGIAGTALSFEPVVAAMDRDKFQPWILQYPSGLRLDIVSDYLIGALRQLQARTGFGQIIVVAHSMGGLVTRSFVMKHQQSDSAYDLKMVMTINSPLFGMDSAASGVAHSPVVVPAWRDVASGSEFIQTLHQWTWPSTIPYELFFSYLPGETGDGVVALNSQLSVSLQNEAVGIFGFQAQHAGVLKEPEFISKFHQTLANYQ